MSTRLVNGAVDGEIFDLDAFEARVLPALEAHASEDEVDAIREALRTLRVQRDWDDDEIP